MKKKRMFERFFSLLMALILTCSLFTGTVSAQEAELPEETTAVQESTENQRDALEEAGSTDEAALYAAGSETALIINEIPGSEALDYYEDGSMYVSVIWIEDTIEQILFQKTGLETAYEPTKQELYWDAVNSSFVLIRNLKECPTITASEMV